MKKYIGTIILGFCLVYAGIIACASFVSASDVSGARYSGTIRATNNSTAESNIFTTFVLDTATLLSFNFMDSASDAAFVTSTGSDLAFGPAVNSSYPWVFYVPSIGAYSNLDYRLYTGNVTGGKVRYFPGNSGATVSDNAALEPSNNFALTIKVFGDMANTGNFTSKGNALCFARDSSSSVNFTFTDGPYPVIEAVSYGKKNTDGTSHTVNYTAGISAGDFLLVNFVADASATVITEPAGWTVARDATSGACRQSVFWKVANGSETGSVTVTTNNAEESAYFMLRVSGFYGGNGATLYMSSDTGSSTQPEPPAISPIWSGNRHYLKIAMCGYNDGTTSISGYPANYNDNKLNVRPANLDGVGVGLAARNSTSSSTNPSYFTLDNSESWHSNTIYFIPALTTVQATGLTSGEKTLEVYADTTNLVLEIDGVVEDSTALAGASIPDTTDNWTFCQASVTPYVEYIDIDIGGVNKAHWVWEYATTFTDSVSGIILTPTFRTASSDPNVSATMLNFSPVTQAQATASALSYEGVLVESAPTQPSTMYTDNASAAPGIFIAPLINEVLDAGSIPRSLFWYPFAYFCVLAAGALAFRVTQSLTAQAVIMVAMLIIFCLPGLNILGMWTVVFLAFEAFGVIIMSKHFAW